MMTPQFDVTHELEQVRSYKRLRKRKAYAKSRLNRCRAELVALRKAGASYRELVFWLRLNKRIKISHSSVQRYLVQLPEIQEGSHAEFS
ncbi:MAG TPA: hypothetical protein VHE99_11225 [Gammaproteobacteria bacterium]|nr:hypothetical protein [Gammaproteobacteria bacterium]